MGGGGEAKTISTVDYKTLFENEIDASTTQKIEENCISTTSQSNILNIIASDISNLTTNQKNVSTNLCILQTILENTSDIEAVAGIANKLVNEMESKGGDVLGGSAETNSSVKTYNEIKNKIDASKAAEIFKECILNQDQENIITIMGSSVEDSSLSQLNDNIAKCMTEHKDVSDLGIATKSTAETAIDQILKATGGSINFGASFSEKFSKLERYKKQAEEEKQNNKNRKVSRSVKIQKNNILDGLGNLEGMFGNLLNNKELMNIASEITDDLKNKKINPVELLSGMMTGKPSGEMKNLMDDITNKLEYKIESGQLNKEELEKEANNVIENIKNSDVESKIPMLKSMFKNTDLNNN
jgi:hypothetical protein